MLLSLQPLLLAHKYHSKERYTALTTNTQALRGQVWAKPCSCCMLPISFSCESDWRIQNFRTHSSV